MSKPPTLENDDSDGQTKEDLLTNFSSYTTLHGLHFTFNKTIRVRQVIWVLLLIASTIALLWQLYYGWRKLVAFDHVVQVATKKEIIVDFPAVSICSNNMMRKSKIVGTDAQRYLDLLDERKRDKWSEIEKEFNKTLDVQDAVYKYGHNLAEALQDCEYPQNRKCKPKDFAEYFEFRYGLCYTFNADKVYRSINAGVSYGLSLTLDSQPEEYYGPYSLSGTGYRVIIHDQAEYPSMERDGWEIMPGVNTNMRITRKQLKSLESPYRTNCTNEQRYTSESHCLQDCYSEMATKKCKCRILGMPGNVSGDLPWCVPSEIRTCIYLEIGKAKPSSCQCQVKCERVEYDVQLSSLYYPPHNYIEPLLQQRNISTNDTEKYYEWYRKRVVKLNVFYKDLSTEILTEQEAYGLNELAGDLGGNMGLFLGCSILTICEFIDLLVMLCVSRWKKSHHRTNRVQ